ncbi:5-oxoprolinase subunit PxpA [Rhodophyticola sp. CCM32]|uniref:LamB/YcsF family protein n=1 Tax=Rhodophyticola sp. CCM32 TaxID=2916397 RepID=UPI00107F403D|nr:5-oxoprolinase subunit PxpA [Rhodophyticola sp. CCM32]QBY00853.1 5-oxoprolinase subunit PxpA [Rhodophyticola sp. CCM32]
MSLSVDLNADMGESFGPWVMGRDAELLQIITSANVACGAHAGDPDVMAETMAIAVENRVGIGAHPGFPDLQGFGRRRMHLPHKTLANFIRFQLGAAQAMATAAGGKIRHLKLHGALGNMTSEDGELARACYDAGLSVDPDIIIMVLAATAQEQAARALGCAWAGEIFADRAYNEDATLVDRSQPGAVIHDAAIAGPRIASMVKAGAIITGSGREIPAAIDTICLHGDTPEAVEIARSVRAALETEGVAVTQFPGRRA